MSARLASARAAAPAAGLAATAALAALLCGCGLVHKDVHVEQDFTVGGGAPNAGTVPANAITQPLAASAGDLDHLSSVTLEQVTLEATDTGDLAFVASATLTIRGNGGLPDLTLATLAAPGAVTSAQFQLQDMSRDLKPYLAAGSELSAALNYTQRPAAARGLRLGLTLRATVL